MTALIATDRPPEPSALRLIFTLALAGLISGSALVMVYELTFDTIAANRAAELRQAVFTVLPDTVRLAGFKLDQGKLTQTDDGATLYAGYDEQNRFTGYAIPASGAGFQDTIKLIYGLDPRSRSLSGMQVLESRETPGLGDKIYKDLKFVAEFSDLQTEPTIELIKGRGNLPNQVDAITGATISSKAVVNIINQSMDNWLPLLPEEVATDE